MDVLIYRGKMNWEGYADNEEFTVILPYGTSRLDDPIHLYWQWTRVDNGDTKVNVLSRTTITGVTQTAVYGEAKFSCVHDDYYTFDITSKNHENKLSIYMSNPAGYTSKEMILEKFPVARRLADSDYSMDPEKPRPRIYAGKLNWYEYAVNELFIVVLPDGFGDAYPVTAHWQWTVTGSGTKKINCDANDDQKYHDGDPKVENHFQFIQGNYYVLSCVADDNTSTLTVTMKNPNGDSAGSTTLQLQEIIDASSDKNGARRKRAIQDHTTTITNGLEDVVICTFSPAASSSGGKIMAVGGFGMSLVGFIPTILTTLPTPVGWAVTIAGLGVAIIGVVDVAVSASDPTARPLFPGDVTSNRSSGGFLVSANNVLVIRAFVETKRGAHTLTIKGGVATDVKTEYWNLKDDTGLQWSDYFRIALPEQYHIQSYRGIPIRHLKPNWDGEEATDEDIGLAPDQYALYCEQHDKGALRYGLTIEARHDPQKDVLFNCVPGNSSFIVTQGTKPGKPPKADLGDYHVKALTNGNIAVRVKQASVRIKRGSSGIRPFEGKRCNSEDEVYEAITNNPGYFAYEWSTHTGKLYCWTGDDADQIVKDSVDNVYFVVPGIRVSTNQFLLKGAPSS